jgi:spore maturation protein CgeB
MAAKGILTACYEFWPDIVLIVSGFFVPAETLDVVRSRGHKIVFLNTESPYEDEQQLARACHADMVLLNDPTNLEAFRKRNPNSHYVPHAYNPARHHPGSPVLEMVSDFTFVGTGFPSRVEFFEAVDFAGLDAVLAGAWVSLPDESPLAPLLAHRKDWCCDNEETAQLYRSTKTSLNLYRREAHEDDTADGWACGPREIELAACGTWFMRDSRPESDDLFPMLPTFSEPGEVRPLIDWALTHPGEREEAAAKANAAIADRTFGANARWLLEHLDK